MSSKIIPRGLAPASPPVVWPRAGEGVPLAAPWPRDGAPELLPEVERAVEERVGQAHRAGYREGEAAGLGQARAETRLAMERLVRTVEELASLKPRLREQAESDLVRLAVAIARRVLHRELTVDPQAIRGLIQAALVELAAGELSRVRVHPDHEVLVRELLAAAGRDIGVEVVGDAAIERGGAVFETARGSLDASVETQLVEIERGLTDRFRRSS